MEKVVAAIRGVTARIVVLGAVAVSFPASADAGGTYEVAECSPGHRGTPDASVEGSSVSYSASTSCETGNWLQVQSADDAQPGTAKQWIYRSPSGTRINDFRVAYNLVGDTVPAGNRSYFFTRTYGSSNQENLSVVGTGSTSGIYDSGPHDLRPYSSVGAGVFCSRTTEPCSRATGQMARLGAITFQMEDLIQPSQPIFAGEAASGDWVGGEVEAIIGDVDQGSGAARSTIEVNGAEIVDDEICDPGEDASGAVGSMAPCGQVGIRFVDLATGAPPFTDGSANSVRVCTYEYGVGAERACKTSSMKVDNVAPSAPLGLEVVGGSGWRRDNDFDLRWENPPQAHSPIAGARVTITGPGAHSETTDHSGTDLERIDGVEVPAVGSYTAQVQLVDAAGNTTAASSAGVTLRFDDTVPVKSQPEKANGWISRAELDAGYEQTWTRPSTPQVPPSGIEGYRAVSDTSPGTDPCDGASDHRACGGALTEAGIGSNRRLLDADDLAEGTNHFHVVPVSGSGMRATAVGHTPLKVDLTDPRTELGGVPDGWARAPVEVEAVATDPLSGMEDTDEFPDDAAPRTVVSVDGSAVEDADGDVAATVSGEGVHQVRYWARDLAGNENDGAAGNAEPGTASVRIDSTAPSVGFTNHQDPEDPDRLVAPASDGLSGVAGGAIAYREQGAVTWTALETTLTGGELVARIDSADMDPAIRYEFRARAVDAAGNERLTTKRADGSEMSVVGPFRAATAITGFGIGGKQRIKVRYGKQPVVAGWLVDSSGAGVPGADVELEEELAAGAASAGAARVLRTDGAGRFSAKLPKGPSRAVVASFSGDRKRLGSASSRARLQVKAGVTLRTRRSVRAGSRIVFGGRVKARGARFARRGKSVEVQVRVGSRWKTVGRSIHTDGNGRYRLHYRFVATYTKPVRYRFRTVVLRERGWPYLPAVSRVRSVTVRP